LAHENLAQANEKYAQHAHHCWIFWWIRCRYIPSTAGRLSYRSFERDATFNAHHLFRVRFRTATVTELVSGFRRASTFRAYNGGIH
jgi:hypothetical protein